jgi:hypothetical protein
MPQFPECMPADLPIPHSAARLRLTKTVSIKATVLPFSRGRPDRFSQTQRKNDTSYLSRQHKTDPVMQRTRVRDQKFPNLTR